MVSLRRFRILIGSMVLVSHFSAIIIMASFSLAYGLSTKELIGNVVAITPIAGLYAVTYYRYIAVNPNELTSEIGMNIGKASSSTQFGVVGIFCAALILAPIYFFTYGVMSDAKIFVGGLETVFGAFIGRTFGLLFPSEILGEAMQTQQVTGG